MPKVAIIVLNWQNAGDTIACLKSLQTIIYPAFIVFVIDNGSTDDSVILIQKAHPDIPVICTGQNLGYAGGNNYAIKNLLNRAFDYICILNNDVVMSNDSLKTLVRLLETDVTIDVVTPLIGEMPVRETVWAAGISINRHTGAVRRNGSGEAIREWMGYPPFPVDAISGAAFVARREVWEKAGLFDENFFLYYEEVDWSLRVQKMGYKIVTMPQVVVWHKVSATLGTTSPLIDYYMLRNHLYLINKHWGTPYRWLLSSWIIFRNLLAVASFTFKSHNGKRLFNRNARLFALRDAILGRFGKMGTDIEKSCSP